MSSQPEDSRRPAPQDETGANDDAVRSRISELLDNATVIPEDDLVRSVKAESGVSQEARLDDPAGSEDSGTAPEPGRDTVDVEPSGHVSEANADVRAQGPEIADEEPQSEDPAQAQPGEDLEAKVESPQEDLQDAGDEEPQASVAETAEPPADVEDSDKLPPAAVRIRGRPGGVLVEIDDAGDWHVIMELLEERLAAAEGFFRGGKAVVEVGARDVYEDELRQARDLLARHDMMLAVVRSTSDLTLQSSLLLGLSTSNQAERPAEPDKEMAPVVPITQPTSPYFVHNGTLRSGQILRKAESIVVVGDVNPGAKVISGGDVMVWGRLRGMAYAGATGNKGALVAAIEFSPTQLRIASVTAIPPDTRKSRGLKFWKKEPERRPEVAHIADGRIVVEPWDDSRPGRPRVARR